jgi:hypothetical protein
MPCSTRLANSGHRSEIWIRQLRHIAIIAAACLACLAGTVAIGQARYSALSLPSQLHKIMGDTWFQARVQQRVIIRFPSNAGVGTYSVGKPLKYKEEKIGKCILVNRLIGSRPEGKDRLEFVTRDQQLIRAYLGDGCLAREFYAGAYVERSTDGKLCVDRDILHARTGAQCEIDKFRLLVPQKAK